MALENLQNVFKNESPKIGDIEKNIATQQPVDNEPVFDSVFDDLVKLNPIQIRQQDSPQTKLPGKDFQIQYGQRQDEPLDLRKVSITEDSEDGRIVLGTTGKLGFGDFVLETLYNKNHTANTNRVQIQHGQTLINTGRAGIGSLGNLDIKAHSSGFRTSLASPEPYVINDIGSKINLVGNDRDLIPFQAGLEDSSRLLKFYSSPAGVAFAAKENIVNQAIGTTPNNNPTTRFLDQGLNELSPLPTLNTNSKILIPPVNNPIQGNTGFLNITNQFRDLGPQIASARKPTTVEYSKRSSLGLPFGFLGDNAVRTFADEEPILETRTTKKPRFLGLGKGPRWTNNDKISDSGVINSLGTDSSGDEALPEDFPAVGVTVEKGDFYVRLKDLRDNSFIFFRGYVTGITENVSPSFTPTNYIGRSEPVYSYERAERDISFNLRVYPANINQRDKMYEKLERLTSLAYPEYINDNDGLTRMKPPFTELYMAHIGTRVQGQFGFIKSISYTVPGEGDWDALTATPRLFDIAISYQILSKRPPGLNTDNNSSGKFYGDGR